MTLQRRSQTAAGGPPARTRALLARVLDDPGFVQAVRELQPEQLTAIVRHVGLEDAGELVAAVTPEQLLQVLDEDLWRQDRPSADEELDAEQLGLWLEVLLEAGEERLVDKLLALPEDLVVLALHRLILVLDMDALGQRLAEHEQDDVDQIEKALDSGLYLELDELRVVSRNDRVFDAVTTALLALDRTHHDVLRRWLERLAAASSELTDDPLGLVTALSEAELIESDGAAEREDRRAAQGHVAPASARAFLGLCRSVDAAAVLGEPARDPVTRAYFRELAPRARAPRAPLSSRPLAELLAAASAGSERAAPRRALGGRGGRAPSSAAFGAALRELSITSPRAHAERLEELAYLVNVLVAGHDAGGRPPTPAEAIELALAACARGLRRARTLREAEAAATLAEVGAERLFRIGWEQGGRRKAARERPLSPAGRRPTRR